MNKFLLTFSCLVISSIAQANVLINLPAKTMWIDNGDEILEYPVAVGKISSQSPTGTFNISEIRKNPAWYVPANIQKEMASKGKTVQTVVKAGPNNPLGTVFVRLGNTSYGFHGTNAPRSIGFSVSHGCIRMNNEHVKEVADMVKRGDQVRLIYEPVVLDLSGENPIVTIHPNIYAKKGLYKIDKIWENVDSIYQNETNQSKLEDALKKMDKKRNGESVSVTLEKTA